MKTTLCLLLFIAFPITTNSVRASDIYLGLSNFEGNVINNIDTKTNKELRTAETTHKKELIDCLTLKKSEMDDCALQSKIKYNSLLTEINGNKMSKLKAVYLDIAKISEDE